MTEIRIYVADLAAYNNGILHGCWIDATDELDSIQEQVNEMLANSPEEYAEEYAIHDYEGYGSSRLSEYEGLESANAVACFLEEFGEIASDVLAHFGDDLDDARKSLEENYQGCHESLAYYAQELIEETSGVPRSIWLFTSTMSAWGAIWSCLAIYSP